MMSKQNRKQGDKSQAMSMTAVPVGYKQTEVGIIPKDWIVVPFFDVVSIASGQVSPLCEPYCSMVLVAPDHIEAGTGLLINKQTAKEQNSISGKYVFHPGDTLYSKIRPYLKKAIYANFNGLCSADMYPLRPKEGVEPKFILPLILGERFSKYAESVSARSGMPKINRAEIADFLFVMPSQRKEQTAISNVLSDTDKLIIALEKIIAKKLAIKIATMQQLLTGRTRLPQFSKHPKCSTKTHKINELEFIPGDWEVIKLGKIAKFLKGSGLPKSALCDDGEYRCIHYGQLFTVYGPQIKEVKSKTNFNGFIKSEKNDVLMPTSDVTPNGLATASCIIESGVTLGGDILIIRVNEKILNGVYFSYLVTIMRDQVMQLVTGSTVYHLYGSDMAKFCFAIPPENEQTAIANILSDMDAELTALEQKLAKVRDIKQGMMQQLLTGRIRLPLDHQP